MRGRRRYTEEELDYIFDKNDRGLCPGCGKRLSRNNYGPRGDMIYRRAAWEVDHFISIADGGRDEPENWIALCLHDNMLKGDRSGLDYVWEWHGRSGYPMDEEECEEQRSRQTWGAGAIGAGVGFLLGGPVGALIGAGVGAKYGNNQEPDPERNTRQPRFRGKKR